MLEKGKYYVGDLCYVLDSRNGFDWMDVLNETGFLGLYEPGTRNRRKNTNKGYMTYKDVKFFSSRTAHGDGCFHDRTGREYGVDAGLIGCYPMKMLPEGVDTRGGNVIDFSLKDFSCYPCEGKEGTISIGHLRIRTNFDEEE